MLTFAEIENAQMKKQIQSALISVFNKDGLKDILQELKRLKVTIYSTGGTRKYIEEQGLEVVPVESITDYPSILDGRVKTLHPKVFGGILARREKAHLDELKQYDIPEIDLVVVDLYPFEQTVAQTSEEATIIEKIDIGGISLIRAAAKNYKDVLVVPSKDSYSGLLKTLQEKNGETALEERQAFAREAFKISSNYDTAIFNHFNKESQETVFKQSVHQAKELRYGENPHQKGIYYGDLDAIFEKLNGKELSYNNLVDIDAAVALLAEFRNSEATFAVLKHTNPCGIATRPSLEEAWIAALAGDPVSAFGGILVCNREVDEASATRIKELFFEVIIAPSFSEAALDILKKKKKRILLKDKGYEPAPKLFKRILNGVIEQEADLQMETADNFKTVTKRSATKEEVKDLIFANKCAKHLKSNTIAIVKNEQLIGMGCGQTSRVDALKQAIIKAKAFGFNLEGSVMASDAFFPFPDCVEIAAEAGIKAVVQPGGSIKDQLSIDACDANEMAMVMTGNRHFKH